jgi:Flp pilus assembly protein TadG
MIADRRASVTVIMAVTITMLALCVGLAIDGTRLWLVRAKLQEAIDAAVLLGAMEIGSPTQAADVQSLFWVNFSGTGFNAAAGASNVGFLGATSGGATVTAVDSTHVQVSAQASVPLTFMRLAHNDVVSVVSENAVAQQGGINEIALALDITGSMTIAADSSGTTKIQAVQTAVKNMLSVLYGSADTVPNLWVSVVPFRGSVNIGTQNQAWLAKGAYKASDWSAQAWRGCVEARQNGYDVTEDDPNTKGFTPLRWASTYQVHSTWGGYSPGDNDWYAYNVTDTGNGGSGSGGSGGSSTFTWYGMSDSSAGMLVGPNLGCSNGVVLPLTASKSTVGTTVSNLIAATGGSTVLSQGLQWAWFTLSPLWQADWKLASTVSGSSSAPRPLAYSTPGLHKTIILMTDGNDEWDGSEMLDQNQECSDSPTLWPECVQTDGYYNSYGRLSDNRINATWPSGSPPNSSIQASQNAASALDKLTSQVCTAIKATGITIYTIGFQAVAGSDAETVLKGCATDAAHYFDTNTGTDINNAFRSIAQQMSSIRLTQ